MLADRYKKTSLECETIAYEFSSFLNTNFELENAESLKSATEGFMYTMAEADIEYADKMLLNYQVNKFILKPNEKTRNWVPTFGYPIQSAKKKFTHPWGQSNEFLSFCLHNQTVQKIYLPCRLVA